MFCTNCGRRFEGSFCPYCGTPIIELRGGAQPSEPVPEPTNTAPPPSYHVRGIPAAAVTTLFVVALALGVLSIVAACIIII